MRRIVALLADTHAGHKLALCNPETRWEDEDAQGGRIWVGPTLTETQKWLWERYTEQMGQLLEFARGDAITLIHNGDITWGVKYPEQLVSSRIDVQPTIGYYNLLPWLKAPNVQTVRLVHGTPSHEFGLGSSNRQIAQMIGMAFPGKNVASPRHLLASIDGLRIDVAHHGPSGGIRVWTAGNQFRYNLRSIMLDELLKGHTPPRVVVRAHYHTYLRETVRVQADREVVSDILMIPGYCGFSHYTVQASRSAYTMHAGMVAVEVIDGVLGQIAPFVETLDIRTEEEL